MLILCFKSRKFAHHIWIKSSQYIWGKPCKNTCLNETCPVWLVWVRKLLCQILKTQRTHQPAFSSTQESQSLCWRKYRRGSLDVKGSLIPKEVPTQWLRITVLGEKNMGFTAAVCYELPGAYNSISWIPWGPVYFLLVSSKSLLYAIPPLLLVIFVSHALSVVVHTASCGCQPLVLSLIVGSWATCLSFYFNRAWKHK